MKQKFLFIDRDGSLIVEPADKQVDNIEKLALLPHVIPVLLQLKKTGYRFVMVTNQDGLGSANFMTENFYPTHHFLLKLLKSQGIHFDAVKICPHQVHESCQCRKPRTALLLEFFLNDMVDKDNSYIIGDRDTDMQLADALGLKGLRVNQTIPDSWLRIGREILSQARIATIKRQTLETQINCAVNLDNDFERNINTGIPFFDHMLDQLAMHGGFGLHLEVKGDLEIDDHHTVEDTAIALGEALQKALGNKKGIARYGFLLPMDDALAQIALDLCNRSYLKFIASFPRTQIGNFSTEMVQHFFRSFSASLSSVMHIQVEGQNTHHMIEAVFKGVGRCLRQAIQVIDQEVPTTKGVI